MRREYRGYIVMSDGFNPQNGFNDKIMEAFPRERIDQVATVALDDFVIDQDSEKLLSRFESVDRLRRVEKSIKHQIFDHDLFTLGLRSKGWVPLHRDEERLNVFLLRHEEHGVIVIRATPNHMRLTPGGRPLLLSHQSLIAHCDKSATEFVTEQLAGMVEENVTLDMWLESNILPECLGDRIACNVLRSTLDMFSDKETRTGFAGETYTVPQAHRVIHYLTRVPTRHHHYVEKDGIYYSRDERDGALIVVSDKLGISEMIDATDKLFEEVHEWAKPIHPKQP